MKGIHTAIMGLAFATSATLTHAQAAKYPPISEYLMQQDDEIALAKSAAPAEISSHASIEVLTASGFHVVHAGDNGFVCMVMRGFTGAPTFTPTQFRLMVFDPKTRAPICFNPQAVSTVLPYYELRTKLGLAGQTPDEIAQAVQSAYGSGVLPHRDAVSFEGSGTREKTRYWNKRQRLVQLPSAGRENRPTEYALRLPASSLLATLHSP